MTPFIISCSENCIEFISGSCECSCSKSTSSRCLTFWCRTSRIACNIVVPTTCSLRTWYCRRSTWTIWITKRRNSSWATTSKTITSSSGTEPTSSYNCTASCKPPPWIGCCVGVGVGVGVRGGQS